MSGAITACVVARNEAELLGDCLASVQASVAEIVVVDHQSHDDTATVARAHGARVLRSAEPFHERARNAYLEAARTPWVLVVDADERLAAGGDVLEALTSGAAPETFGFALERFDWIGRGRWASTRLVRLFRVDPRVRYFASRAHAAVTPAIADAGGKVELAPARLHHLDALLPRDHLQKRAGMRSRLEAELASGAAPTILRCFYALELWAVGQEAEAAAQLERAMREDPRCEPIARLFLAQQHLHRGRLERALRESSRALELGGNPRFRGHSSARVVVADALARMGRRTEAIEATERALESEPHLASHHLNLAALLGPGDLERAREHRERARMLNPWIGTPLTMREGASPSILRQQDALLACVELGSGG